MSTEDFNNPFRNLHLSKLESESEKEGSEKEKEVSEPVGEAYVSEDLACSRPKEDLKANQDKELFLQAMESMTSPTYTDNSFNLKLESALRLVAVSGEKIKNTKVLSSADKELWQERKEDENLFLEEIKRLEKKPNEEKSNFLTLGEQFDFEKLTSRVDDREFKDLKKETRQSYDYVEEDLEKADDKSVDDLEWSERRDFLEQDLDVRANQFARSLEEASDNAMFLQAWYDLEKVTEPKKMEGNSLADLSQKWRRRNPQVRVKKVQENFEETQDSKLFMRAMQKLENKPKESKERKFSTLGEQCPKLLQAKPKTVEKPKKVVVKKVEPEVPEDQENQAFLKAVSGATPLKHNRIIPPEPLRREITAPSQENLAELLEGKYNFEIFCRDEYFEGYISGLDLLTVDKLRSGMYSPEAHLDLHGFVVEEAYQAVRDFIKSCWFKGLRTILLVPGRGHNSILGIGVLRSRLQAWLTQEPLKRVVLAFCTAQPSDGGPGSVYVLLRKYRKKGRVCWQRQMDDYINL